MIKKIEKIIDKLSDDQKWVLSVGIITIVITGLLLGFSIMARGCEEEHNKHINNNKKDCIAIYKLKGKDAVSDFCAKYVVEYLESK